MKRSVTIKLDNHLVEQTDRLARQKAVSEDRPITRTEIVSEALTDYLKKAEREKGQDSVS